MCFYCTSYVLYSTASEHHVHMIGNVVKEMYLESDGVWAAMWPVIV